MSNWRSAGHVGAGHISRAYDYSLVAMAFARLYQIEMNFRVGWSSRSPHDGCNDMDLLIRHLHTCNYVNGDAHVTC